MASAGRARVPLEVLINRPQQLYLAEAVHYHGSAMLTRRRFLRNAAALLPAASVAGPNARAGASIPLGVQLYTVRRQAQQNLPQVLDQIRHIGYQEVETCADNYTFSADALRHMIVDAGLRVPSGHFNYEDFASRFNYASELGLEWMVCPMIPQSMWGSADAFRTAAKQFNDWAKSAKDLGMRFAFHNHDYEFAPLQPEPAVTDASAKLTGYDVLIENTDPELVFFEVDCYWVAQAGLDPVRLMERLGPRLRMLHLKDRAPGSPPSFVLDATAAHFVPVGRGTLDWMAILSEGKHLGVEHYFVEQDETRGSPVDALRQSYRYLRTLS